jgi:hypothetical protein
MNGCWKIATFGWIGIPDVSFRFRNGVDAAPERESRAARNE